MTIQPIEDARFSLGTLHQADRLARTDPAQLTDLHLRHLVIYAPEAAARALRARDAALDDRRLKALQPAPEPPAVTKPAAPAYVTRTYLAKEFKGYTDALVEILKAQKARLDAQAAELADTKQRVLELEATAAARAKVDA
jgi:hypothetical protein